MQSQKSFETARGISGVEVVRGYTAISAAGRPAVEGFSALRKAEVSADFLKLTGNGFNFLVPDELANKAVEVLSAHGFQATAKSGRAILKVFAPNVRDESGLVARIAELVVTAGASIEHVGDMHAAVMVVIEGSRADGALAAIEACIGDVVIL